MPTMETKSRYLNGHSAAEVRLSFADVVRWKASVNFRLTEVLSRL
jgi:hypothetical protein